MLATLLLNTIVVIGFPEQTVWLEAVATTLGVGLTITEALIGTPAQPLAVGVIVNIGVLITTSVLINVPEILPLPLAPIVPKTVTTLFLVQLNVVVATLPDNEIVVIEFPEQIV